MQKSIRSVDHNGTIWWKADGQYHRLDGPAIEYADGTKFWVVEGKPHRLDGPATEYADGTKFWVVEGKPHRLDGPAVEYTDGRKEWYVNGIVVPILYSATMEAAISLGLSIDPKILRGTLKLKDATKQKGVFRRLLVKHWPAEIPLIMERLLHNSDPEVRRLAFTMLKRV